MPEYCFRRMADINFTKMHGLGNDYVYIDCLGANPTLGDDISRLAIEMSDRHTGVGGDGIILITPDDEADCRMRMFNADGSEGMMCGNGIRCVAKYVYDNRLVHKPRITVNTLAGIKVIDVVTDTDDLVIEATVDMGTPEMIPALIPVVHDGDQMVDEPVETAVAGYLKLTAVSMGNPHGVIFVDDLEKTDVHAIGRELETAPIWPDRANIELVEVLDTHNLRMRVWERGSGETMACGTGACASAVAAVHTGRTHWPVTVHLLGGSLRIERCDDGHIMMTGPATTVFTGTYFTN